LVQYFRVEDVFKRQFVTFHVQLMEPRFSLENVKSDKLKTSLIFHRINFKSLNQRAQCSRVIYGFIYVFGSTEFFLLSFMTVIRGHVLKNFALEIVQKKIKRLNYRNIRQYEVQVGL
jgi:hypothetical protein